MIMAYTANVKAYEKPGECITLVPDASFEKKRYTFVTADATHGMVTPAAGNAAVGVLQTPGIAGEPCNVMTTGVSFIVLGGTVANGDMVESDAEGKAIKNSTGVARGMCLVGGTTGQIGCIQLY